MIEFNKVNEYEHRITDATILGNHGVGYLIYNRGNRHWVFQPDEDLELTLTDLVTIGLKMRELTEEGEPVPF